MTVCPTCRTRCDDRASICPMDGTPLPREGDLVGRVLGDRYRVLSRIGEGGMGTVYLAEHVVLGKRVAVKVLRPELSRDEELSRRFEQEAVSASRVGQENIVDVNDFGRTPEGSLYFVMEALEGENLAAALRRESPMALRRALPILSQICRALGAAHARGIVHRDLKPENVFLTRREDGTDFVKVLDFGISKSGAVPDGGRITRAGSIIGTPEYMAPEQAAATQVDHRCDVYAFGVLAYEVLTGSLPFQGETPLATLLKHQGEPPEPPRRRRADLPVEAESLVLRALVKRPEGRQQTMAEVAADLSRALAAVGLGPVYTPPFGTRSPSSTQRFSPVPSRLSGRGETMALDPEETPPSAPAPAAPAAPPRARVGFWGGIAAAALAGAALSALVVPRLGATPRPPPAPAESPIAAAPVVAPPAAAIPSPAAASPPDAPGLVHVQVRSVPSGAAVFEGRVRVGVTPLEVEIPAGGAAEYRFVRAGYRSLSRTVEAAAGEVEVRLPRAGQARRLPAALGSDDNPYGKVDDLKDPYR